MNSYLLIILADILLAISFVYQKKYQNQAGTSVKACLSYNLCMGIISAAMFLAISGFTVTLTWFSVICAFVFSILFISFMVIGFRLMEKGSMSLYTLFLMSGAMTIPYIYGLVFLNETLSVMRTIGLLLFISAILIANLNKNRIDKSQLLLCVLVFVINGFVNVISKMHQVSFAGAIVSSTDYAFIINVCKAFVSLVALLFIQKTDKVNGKVTIPPKSLLLIILLAAIPDGVSYMLQLIGATNIPATVMFPLLSGGVIILSTLVDFVFFKERISSKQWIAVGISVLGTFLFL